MVPSLLLIIETIIKRWASGYEIFRFKPVKCFKLGISVIICFYPVFILIYILNIESAFFINSFKNGSNSILYSFLNSYFNKPNSQWIVKSSVSSYKSLIDFFLNKNILLFSSLILSNSSISICYAYRSFTT